MPCAWPVTDDMKAPEHWPIATGKACYVGDIVAVVVADSRYGVAGAVDAVVVDYDPLPAVSDLEEAAGDSVVIHDALGTNRSYTWTLSPDPANGRRRLRQRRSHGQRDLRPAAADPRSHGAQGVAAVPGVYGGDLTFYSATQIPHILKVQIAAVCGVPEHKVRVVAPGGRRLRVQAQRLRRGPDRGGGGPAAERPRQLDREPVRARWPPSRAEARSSTWSWRPTPTARSRPCGPR